VSRFRPLLPGGHLQTLGGVLARSFLKWPFPSEDIVVEAGHDVRLLLRASWQEKGADRPALLLVHGLEGSDEAHYLVSTGVAAFRSGWHVVRMNMRGCGDSLSLCPQLYNAGLTGDLRAATEWLASRVARFAIVGFSLGAGLTLLTLARERRRLPGALKAASAVCPPLDMTRCADALEERANFIYQARFTGSLCASYKRRQRRAPERYELGRERGITTLRQFDDVITAFYGGYRNAEAYYQSVSTGPVLAELERPTLVLSSTNDPFIPLESVLHWQLSGAVTLEITKGAGHVGFVGPSCAPRFFWAADRVLRFFEQIDSLSIGI